MPYFTEWQELDSSDDNKCLIDTLNFAQKSQWLNGNLYYDDFLQSKVGLSLFNISQWTLSNSLQCVLKMEHPLDKSEWIIF